MPVLKGWATLAEVETQWSLCDLADALEIADLQKEAAEAESKAAQGGR